MGGCYPSDPYGLIARWAEPRLASRPALEAAGRQLLFWGEPSCLPMKFSKLFVLIIVVGHVWPLAVTFWHTHLPFQKTV